MTRFEVLKRIEKEEQFADLIVGFVEQFSHQKHWQKR